MPESYVVTKQFQETVNTECIGEGNYWGPSIYGKYCIKILAVTFFVKPPINYNLVIFNTGYDTMVVKQAQDKVKIPILSSFQGVIRSFIRIPHTART